MRLSGNPKKLEKHLFNLLEPGIQEPRSPRKSWGAILVPDPGGSKKEKTRLFGQSRPQLLAGATRLPRQQMDLGTKAGKPAKEAKKWGLGFSV